MAGGDASSRSWLADVRALGSVPTPRPLLHASLRAPCTWSGMRHKGGQGDRWARTAAGRSSTLAMPELAEDGRQEPLDPIADAGRPRLAVAGADGDGLQKV